MNIIINTLSIVNSGGITVFDKLLDELKDSNNKYLIICNQNENIINIIEKYDYCKKFEFLIIVSKGFLKRLYFENIIFRKIIKEKKISLIYNFSGTAQFFLTVPQIIKVHNLLFYSKKIDKVYFEKRNYLAWLKQIFLKRLVLHTMIRQVKYIEVQSMHVKEYISDFIEINNKIFFIKSDIEIKEKLFQKIKEYDFSKKIRFLYIVGPHFEYLHKNIEDFVQAMGLLKTFNISFEINITLSKEELTKSILWNEELNNNTNFLGYISKEEIKKQFIDNTILISTSVIESLGLHVIEAIQNGILAICPNENYCKSVYGNDIITYELFNEKALINEIKKVVLLSNNNVKDIIQKNQQYLIKNENKKYQNILDIFDEILKDKNV